MPINVALGHVSNDFMIAALLLYSLAVLAFAGDFAFGRPRRATAVAAQPARVYATVGAVAGADAAAPGSAPGVPGSAPVEAGSSAGAAYKMPELQVPALRAIMQA